MSTANMKPSMALLLHALHKTHIPPFISSKTLLSCSRCQSVLPTPQSRDITTSNAAITSSNAPFRSNILRIIRNEIEYQYNYAPSHQPTANAAIVHRLNSNRSPRTIPVNSASR
ncbi:hypothetical protein F2Q69_00033041 [Brassica cretica]|uniref:Uncharacterized protein n=1 Tax=Brassica cretica TaxID=69181 RepID=A0A8S9SIK9_BRACR|nr:hypothetical protein F2Q69_00033041 [Brassica cretica]